MVVVIGDAVFSSKIEINVKSVISEREREMDQYDRWEKEGHTREIVISVYRVSLLVGLPFELFDDIPIKLFAVPK